MKIMLTNARVSFANGLFNATALEQGQTPKFGADFIIEADTKAYSITETDGQKIKKATTMDAAMLAVANEAWKGRGEAMLKTLESSKKSYRDGNLRTNKAGEVYAGYEDCMYVTAKNQVRPGLFDKDGKTQLVEADGRLYSGCYVNVSFDLYAMTDPKKKGVFAKLLGVQFSADGEAFAGGSVSNGDEFEDLAVNEEEGALV